MTAQFYFGLSLVLYLAGAVFPIIWRSQPRRSSYAAHLLSAAAAVSGLISSLLVLLGHPEFKVSVPVLSALADIVPSVKLFAGLSLRMDALSAFFVLVISLLGLPISIYSLGYVREYEGKKSVTLLGILYNLFVLSMILVVTADNALLFLIVWELMSIVSYLLVIFEHDRPENAHAGFVYLVMTHVGTAFLILLFMLFLHQAGSFDFDAFRKVSGNFSDMAKTFLFVFALIGFGTKAGLVPLHIWLPYAHPAAPSHISALMSGVMIKTAIYGIVRVFFDFLQPELVWWWGLVVLVLATISTVWGVLYALMEHDLKKLLAYHSVENIGIILIGIGLAMIGASYKGDPNLTSLAALATIAGLYHLVNHAAFKSLLFLGAGAVISQAHTRNIEELGGLIKLMPWTAAFFLIGAVAISALPPLNGFVSEWLTFQALLLGLGLPDVIVKLTVPISAALLALSGALAAACFVKAFGISFLGMPRSEHAGHVREVSQTMRGGMGFLALLCILLGVLPMVFIPLIDRVTASLLGTSIASQMQFSLLMFAPLDHSLANISPLALGLLLLLILPFTLRLAHMGGALHRRQTQTWGCGLPLLSPRMEYTATGFSKPIRMIFQNIYQPRKEIEVETDVSQYVRKRIRYKLQIEPHFEKYFYEPLSHFILKVSGVFLRIQSGSVNIYLIYILVTLLILLLLVR
ncbi:hydrogenase 4 subunit B [Candidatus Acetothermia bacterium]|nr:hydrogenase 4 subunit B [Candidatus Acetothermia bacterium]